MHFIKTVTSACLLLATLSVAVSYAGDIKGKVTAQGIKSPENIAVYVAAIPGKTFPPPSGHAAMDQRKLTFIPHVLVVLKGTTVDFLNSDAVGHNVYWPAIDHNKKLANNLGTWPQGVKKSFTFDELGVAPLLCNVHSEMSGYIVVVPTPYFAVTSKDGGYEIKGVPPGHYTVTTWNEEGKPATATVDVAAGAAALDLTVHK
jgi:plastocyanin